jgi:O-antigen ligase
MAGIAALDLIPGIILEIYSGSFHPLTSGNRFSGTLHPNIQGTSLSIAIIILCWWGWREWRANRHWQFWAAGILLVFALLTDSRTSLLALAVSIAFSLAIIGLRFRTKATLTLITLLAFTCLAGLAVVLVEDSGGTRTLSTEISNVVRADRDVGDVSDLTGRTVVWDACLRLARNHIVLGFGYGGFWTSKGIAAISDDVNWPVTHSHSAYLDQLLALGIPGISLYTLLLLTSFVVSVTRFIRLDDVYGVWAALLLFMIINGVTESILVMPTFPALALTLIVANIATAPRIATCAYE